MLSAGFGDANGFKVNRRMVMDSFLAGEVCRTCNNGWMSELEDENRDLLIGLLCNSRKLSELGQEERLSLARWTVKTAIACNSAIQEGPRINPEFVRWFDKGRNVNIGRCGVFGGGLSRGRGFGYIQTSQLYDLMLGEGEKEVGVRIALCIDGLVLLTVIVNLNIGYVFELIEKVHEPLWPGRGHTFKEPPSSAGEAGVDLKVFSDLVGVRYRIDKH
jgi:hypothetical protein